jgi:hypothetical protein
MINLQYSEYPSFIFIVFLSNKQLMLSDSRADFWTAATARTVSRSPWTALRPGVVQHGEFHSAEHAGGETVSTAKTTVLTRRSARRVSLRILHWLKTKNIRITVKLLGMCMSRRARAMHEFFFGNLRNPARGRRAGLMHQFRCNQLMNQLDSTCSTKDKRIQIYPPPLVQ